MLIICAEIETDVLEKDVAVLPPPTEDILPETEILSVPQSVTEPLVQEPQVQPPPSAPQSVQPAVPAEPVSQTAKPTPPPLNDLRSLVERFSEGTIATRNEIQEQINGQPADVILPQLASLVKQTPALMNAIIDIVKDTPTVTSLASIIGIGRGGTKWHKIEYAVAEAIWKPSGGEFGLEGDLAKRILSLAKYDIEEATGKSFDPLVASMSRMAPYVMFLGNPDNPPAGSRAVDKDIQEKYPKLEDAVWEQYKRDWWDNRKVSINPGQPQDRIEFAKDQWLLWLKELAQKGAKVDQRFYVPEYGTKVLPYALEALKKEPDGVKQNFDKVDEQLTKWLANFIYRNQMVRIPRVRKTIQDEGDRQRGIEDTRWLPLIEYYLRDNKIDIGNLVGADQAQQVRNQTASTGKVSFPSEYTSKLTTKAKGYLEVGGSGLPDFYKWLSGKMVKARENDPTIPEEAVRGISMRDYWYDAAQTIFERDGKKISLDPAKWKTRGEPAWLCRDIFGNTFSKSQVPSIMQFLRHRTKSVSTGSGGGEGEDFTGLDVSQQDVAGIPRSSTQINDDAPATPGMEFKYFEPDAYLDLLSPERQRAVKRFEGYIKPGDASPASIDRFQKVIKFITSQLYASTFPRNSDEERTRQVLLSVAKFYSGLQWSNTPQDQDDVEVANHRANLGTFKNIEILLDEPLTLRHSEDSGEISPIARYGLAMREVTIDILDFISDPEGQAMLLKTFGSLAAKHAAEVATIIRKATFVLISRLQKVG